MFSILGAIRKVKKFPKEADQYNFVFCALNKHMTL